MLGRSRIAARIVCALALLVPATAHAGLTTTPLAVDGSLDPQFAAPDTGALSVGAADDGDVVAAWRGEGAAPTTVKLLLWRGGLAAPEVVAPGLGTTPAVAMAPGGHALAAWVGSDGRLRIARRAPGGAFGTAVPIDLPLGGALSGVWRAPAVAIRADGSGVVAAPSCRDFGGSAETSVHTVDVAADGAIGAPLNTNASYSTLGCTSSATASAAVGAGGQVAVTICGGQLCKLATRAGSGAPWVQRGVDGTDFGSFTTGAVPAVIPGGKAMVAYLDIDPAPASVRAAIGARADALTQLGAVSDPSVASVAPELYGFGTDALALFQSAARGGGVQVLARPLFAAGSLGTTATLAGASLQASAPFADPHGAAWPDGTSAIAFANQPTVGTPPQLTLLRRALGGNLTPIDVTALPGRAVTLPRIALAGSSAQPLGIVATREAPTGGGAATIVLRRLDGVAPGVALTVPAGGAVGAPIPLGASVSDVSAPVAIAWSFGDGTETTGQGASVNHVYASAGTFTVTVRATDAAGNVGTASATLQIAARGADRTAPAIRRARLTATRFRVGRGDTALTAARRRGTPAGTRLRLALSEAASLRIAVVRVRSGHRSRGRCRANARSGRRCTLRSTVRTLNRQLGAGAATIPFTGRFRGKALAPGRYELKLTARDVAGNTSRAAVVPFAIVRR